VINDDLDSNYERGGFGGPIGLGASPALLVIDFQNAYFDPGSPLFAGEGAANALPGASAVLAAFRQAGKPVVFTKVEYSADGRDGGIFVRKLPTLKAVHPGASVSQIVDQLRPRESEPVITKQYPSAFFGTTLATMLHSWGVDSTVIVGLSTSGCIRASTVDAMQHGFVPVVVEDAVGDRHEGPHRASLFDMAAKYAEVMSSARVVEWLSDGSGTPSQAHA